MYEASNLLHSNRILVAATSAVPLSAPQALASLPAPGLVTATCSSLALHFPMLSLMCAEFCSYKYCLVFCRILSCFVLLILLVLLLSIGFLAWFFAAFMFVRVFRHPLAWVLSDRHLGLVNTF